MIVLIILLIIAIAVALFYRSKAKEFESLFELSKSYDKYTPIYTDEISSNIRPVIPKLNKDGSIAKKRGRKSNVKTT